MSILDKELEKYNYSYPESLIAKKPSNPRDAARLFVYNRKTGEIFHDSFLNLGKYLPKNSLLVFNETRVIPARLPFYKESGGKVEALYVSFEKGFIKVLANKKLNIGQTLYLGPQKLKFVVKNIQKPFYFLKQESKNFNTIKLLNKYGITPLPPYMKDSPLTEKDRRKAYQTIFAKTGESVAAPTASLHFTKRLLNSLKKAGIQTAFVQLDVSLGTFAPLTEDNLKTRKLHEERYFINNKTVRDIQKAKKSGKNIIAVGTTVVRTLESWAKSKKISGLTSLFISPGYKFKVIDNLITNFHVPKSSLMMLVSSLTGREELLGLYNLAINKKYKLFSFGDGMFII